MNEAINLTTNAINATLSNPSARKIISKQEMIPTVSIATGVKDFKIDLETTEFKKVVYILSDLNLNFDASFLMVKLKKWS